MSSPPAAPSSPALELRGITKRFGPLVALDDVSLVIRPGSVHAVLGENGAGKSTLMRVAFGLTHPDAGKVLFHGREHRPRSPRSAIAAGLGMVHQHLSLAPTLRSSENLVLGGRGLLHPARALASLHHAADAAGLPAPPDVPVEQLSIVEQQRLEILKALARNATVLILDEPTSVLAPLESDELLGWLRRFAERGGSVVLVTHKLREALGVADHVTVLRRGRVTFEGEAAGLTESALAAAIFPEGVAGAARAMVSPSDDVVVRARGLDVRDSRDARRIHDASFELHRGEIVGIAAIEGSGHRQLLEALARLRIPSAGTLELPRTIALIPADRARDAVVTEFTIVENFALRALGARRGIMPWNELLERCRRLVDRFGIKARSVNDRVAELSGGNQQRLVLARELEGSADLVVADNPTRGLDARATDFVLDQLRLSASNGACVVVHSSDVDELLSVATRVLVVFQGAAISVELDRDAIGRAMIGAGRASVA